MDFINGPLYSAGNSGIPLQEVTIHGVTYMDFAIEPCNELLLREDF